MIRSDPAVRRRQKSFRRSYSYVHQITKISTHERLVETERILRIARNLCASVDAAYQRSKINLACGADTGDSSAARLTGRGDIVVCVLLHPLLFAQVL